jgi:subtilisin family serine protease
MNPLDLVKLTLLMELTTGISEVTVGLIDGPVAVSNPDLSAENIQEIPGSTSGTCSLFKSAACEHGTFVAGILCGRRSSAAPAICPNCTMLVRPIFSETASGNKEMPSATPDELAAAIVDCIEAGAHVLNLSAGLVQQSPKGERELEQALDYAAKRGVTVVVAAGNQGTIGSSAITRHPWVIPVAACDIRGRPIDQSNFGNSIGRRGLSAPGDDITSLGAEEGKLITLGGTSAAAPFITGTIALLQSEFPAATSAEVKFAVTRAYGSKRTTIVPPLLDAWASYEFMTNTRS